MRIKNLKMLKKNEAHIWIIDLNMLDERIEEFEKLLSVDELRRAERYKFAIDRRLFIGSHGALRSILGGYIDDDPSRISFVDDKFGKAKIKGRSELDFSLSHSGNKVVIGVVALRKIGVDIECIDHAIDCDAIAENYFLPDEVEQLKNMERKEKLKAFYVGWTQKEAYLKAKGIGLSMGAANVRVSLGKDAPDFLIVERNGKTRRARWTVERFEPDADHIGAVVVEGDGCKIKYFVA
ncbi:MAG: 4'-phosphopantetheinyl transferase superfamily protein [Anaerolineae bacterium]|nr:4'-phosphopantetheinyl transferase superfamily protein [Anaerolineae bacterium]